MAPRSSFLVRRGRDPDVVVPPLRAQVDVVPFTEDDAVTAEHVWRGLDVDGVTIEHVRTAPPRPGA